MLQLLDSITHFMTRPRRDTKMSTPPKTRPSDRIRVATDNAIGMAIPAQFALHRDTIIRIVRTVNASNANAPHTKLAQYLDALGQAPELAAYAREIEAARSALRALLGGDWEAIGEATNEHGILKPMFFSLK